MIKKKQRKFFRKPIFASHFYTETIQNEIVKRWVRLNIFIVLD